LNSSNPLLIGPGTALVVFGLFDLLPDHTGLPYALVPPPVVLLVFVVEEASAQDCEEGDHVRQQSHQNVIGDEATDGVADEFGDFVSLIH
jgi:hypothetical protein